MILFFENSKYFASKQDLNIFLVCLVRIKVEAPLEPSISNNKIGSSLEDLDLRVFEFDISHLHWVRLGRCFRLLIWCLQYF